MFMIYKTRAGSSKPFLNERIRQSRLKVIKTLDSYDFNYPKQINKQLTKALFNLNFIAEKRNVIFLGPPGVGKTHLASALLLSGLFERLQAPFYYGNQSY